MKRLTEAGTGVTAAGGASAPAIESGNSILPSYEQIPQVGDYLVTHFIGVLSYAEVLQLISAIYLLKMLGVFKLISWGWRKIKARLEK